MENVLVNTHEKVINTSKDDYRIDLVYLRTEFTTLLKKG